MANSIMQVRITISSALIFGYVILSRLEMHNEKHNQIKNYCLPSFTIDRKILNYSYA